MLDCDLRLEGARIVFAFVDERMRQAKGSMSPEEALLVAEKLLRLAKEAGKEGTG